MNADGYKHLALAIINKALSDLEDDRWKKKEEVIIFLKSYWGYDIATLARQEQLIRELWDRKKKADLEKVLNG